MTLVKITNLSKNYHTKTKEIEAIKDITCNIYENEIVTFIGPSGCGKSTILNILSNIDNKYKGLIEKDNNLIIGYMMQNDCLLSWLTVYENAILGLKLKNKYNEETNKYVKDLLTRYGLIDFIDEYPNNLSGGMRQRLALIRTLAIKPDILLLDEPFSKLDYSTRINISDDVYKIIKELKITAILITHDIKEAILMSSRIIILSKRPSTIKEIINLNNEYKIPSEKELENNYLEIHKHIWNMINDD
jgi:NitT/TauT family transport system ATP-binding protein